MAEPAEASLFSFLDDFFNQTEASVEDTGINSQNLALLEAPLNPNPNSTDRSDDITIVEDQALLADTGPLGTLANLEDAPQTDEISIYVVRPGDSLSAIAKMFKVSVNTIRWANDLGLGGIIKEGQTLVILPISGVRHTVKAGDTVKSIAKQYRGDISEIVTFNGLAENGPLAVGQLIIVPDGELAETRIVRPGITSGQIVSAGYFVRPIIGGRKTQGLHGYNAVDLGAPMGTPVLAAADGLVIISRPAGWNGGYGYYVVIRHPNGTQTLYAHLSQNLVAAGQSVNRGEVIGRVGSTGRSTGPHLHFEVRGTRNPF